MNWNQYIRMFRAGVPFLQLLSSTLAVIPLQNVALRGESVQSTTVTDNTLGRARNAIDGNIDATYGHKHCSCTRNQTSPWWRLDLLDVYNISTVMITNRNAAPHRLNQGQIFIGNSLENNGNSNPRCAVISHIPGGHTYNFQCREMAGRYVNVFLHGAKKILTLCEVEVYASKNAPSPTPPNMALKGEATQSSTLSVSAAAKAIDGKLNSFYSSGSCSHTAENEANPWWRLDLQQAYSVTSVKVTNRGDCCPERLDGAEIRIGNSLENDGNNNSRCAVISHIRAGKTYTYHCAEGDAEGRYVNVIIPGARKTLTLCEVEVYAAPADFLTEAPLQNVAKKKNAEQSSLYSTFYPSNAVDGDRTATATIGYQSCSHTLLQTDPWWRVDLLMVYRVSAVAITNRKDCCSERLNGAEIRIGNSLLNNGRENPRCAVIPHIPPGETFVFQCRGMEGQYVSVIIPGDGKMLSLCEVEVYAEEAEVVPPIPTLPPPTPVPPLTRSMLLSGRDVTVVGARLCWSDALFYCRDHHWDLLSLRNEEEQEEMKALLASNPFPLTHYLWLGLRRYVVDDKWFWMSGDSMAYTKWVRDSAPYQQSSHCGGVANGEHFLWEDHPCEDLLNFICYSGADEEVERVDFYSTYRHEYP